VLGYQSRHRSIASWAPAHPHYLGPPRGFRCRLPLRYSEVRLNPVHLRSARVESISTFWTLRRDSTTPRNAIDIMTPNLAEARQVAERIRRPMRTVFMLDSLIANRTSQELAASRAKRRAARTAFRATPRAPTAAEIGRGDPEWGRDHAANSGEQTGSGDRAEAANELDNARLNLARGPGCPDAREFAVHHRQGRACRPEDMVSSEKGDRGIPTECCQDWLLPGRPAAVWKSLQGDPMPTECCAASRSKVLDVEPRARGGRSRSWKAAYSLSAHIEAGSSLVSIADPAWIVLRRFSASADAYPLVLAGS